MRWSEARQDIRELLQDEREVLRWQDDDIRRALNAGLRLAYLWRPDIFLNQEFPTKIEAAEIDDDGDPLLPIGERYASSLCEYAAGWCFARDDEYNADGRAGALKAQFMTILTGRGAAAA
jgi:hypothetical protein